MKSTIRQAALALVLGAAAAGTAQAGLLTYQGVTFSSTWNANVLTLEIDAANHSGDWAAARGLEALAIKDIGNYTSVSVTSAPKGTSGWTTSSSELTAGGCSANTSGQDGSRLCFFGNRIALGDDMVFSFAFSGKGVIANDPHVKVEFVDAKGDKAGSLLSQTLLPVAVTQPSPTQPGASTGGGAAGTQVDVPEPWSPALLLAGLALMGMVRQGTRRRR